MALNAPNAHMNQTIKDAKGELIAVWCYHIA